MPLRINSDEEFDLVHNIPRDNYSLSEWEKIHITHPNQRHLLKDIVLKKRNDGPPPPPPPPPDTEQMVNLDGSNDHLKFVMDENNPVLNWAESWSIGFSAEEVHGHDSGQGIKRTIARRGDNGIYLIIGTGNVGFYASAMDGENDGDSGTPAHGHGANTWYPSPASVKWLFTYNHTTGILKWYVGEIVNGDTPTHLQRGQITMTTLERTKTFSHSESLKIGDAMGGSYGSTYYDGVLDDALITNNELTGQQVVDYYSNDDFQSHEYNEHIVSVYNFNQVYPNVLDQVGTYHGSHEGSTKDSNFIPNGGSDGIFVVKRN